MKCFTQVSFDVCNGAYYFITRIDIIFAEQLFYLAYPCPCSTYYCYYLIGEHNSTCTCSK